MRETEYLHLGLLTQLDADEMRGAERVDDEDQAEDDPDQVQWLALDEHLGDVIDDVENEPGNEDGDEYGKHGDVIYLVVVVTDSCRRINSGRRRSRRLFQSDVKQWRLPSGGIIQDLFLFGADPARAGPPLLH